MFGLFVLYACVVTDTSGVYDLRGVLDGCSIHDGLWTTRS
jgi:hypothetical protein